MQKVAEVSWATSCCFKALLQKAHIYKNPIDRMVVPWGGGAEQQRGHCNSVLNIQNKSMTWSLYSCSPCCCCCCCCCRCRCRCRRRRQLLLGVSVPTLAHLSSLRAVDNRGSSFKKAKGKGHVALSPLTQRCPKAGWSPHLLGQEWMFFIWNAFEQFKFGTFTFTWN